MDADHQATILPRSAPSAACDFATIGVSIHSVPIPELGAYVSVYLQEFFPDYFVVFLLNVELPFSCGKLREVTIIDLDEPIEGTFSTASDALQAVRAWAVAQINREVRRWLG